MKDDPDDDPQGLYMDEEARHKKSGDIDVVILGAGLSGLIAGRDLALSGYKVCIMDSSHRAGGRVYSIFWPGTTHAVDLGGEWFDANVHYNMIAECKRYGFKIQRPGYKENGKYAYCFSFAGRKVVTRAEMPAEDTEEYDRVSKLINHDMGLFLFSQGFTERAVDYLDVPWHEYLVDRLGIRNQLILEFHLSVGFSLIGSNAKDYSALAVLHLLSGFGSLEEITNTRARDGYPLEKPDMVRLAEGMTALVDRLVDDIILHGGEVKLNSGIGTVICEPVPNGPCSRYCPKCAMLTYPLCSLHGPRVKVADGLGRITRARACIVAVPLNSLPCIRFQPDLPVPIKHASEMINVENSTKAYVLSSKVGTSVEKVQSWHGAAMSFVRARYIQRLNKDANAFRLLGAESIANTMSIESSQAKSDMTHNSPTRGSGDVQSKGSASGSKDVQSKGSASGSKDFKNAKNGIEFADEKENSPRWGAGSSTSVLTEAEVFPYDDKEGNEEEEEEGVGKGVRNGKMQSKKEEEDDISRANSKNEHMRNACENEDKSKAASDDDDDGATLDQSAAGGVGNGDDDKDTQADDENSDENDDSTVTSATSTQVSVAKSITSPYGASLASTSTQLLDKKDPYTFYLQLSEVGDTEYVGTTKLGEKGDDPSIRSEGKVPKVPEDEYDEQGYLIRAYAICGVVGLKDEVGVKGEKLAPLLRRHHPTSRLHKVLSHDWKSDRNSRGGTMALRAGSAHLFADALENAAHPWQTKNLIICGGDLTDGWTGYMEGALCSGKKAAATLTVFLNPPVPVANFTSRYTVGNDPRTT